MYRGVLQCVAYNPASPPQLHAGTSEPVLQFHCHAAITHPRVLLGRSEKPNIITITVDITQTRTQIVLKHLSWFCLPVGLADLVRSNYHQL
jgi:hypothetical protein